MRVSYLNTFFFFGDALGPFFASCHPAFTLCFPQFYCADLPFLCVPLQASLFLERHFTLSNLWNALDAKPTAGRQFPHIQAFYRA